MLPHFKQKLKIRISNIQSWSSSYNFPERKFLFDNEISNFHVHSKNSIYILHKTLIILPLYYLYLQDKISSSWIYWVLNVNKSFFNSTSIMLNLLYLLIGFSIFLCQFHSEFFHQLKKTLYGNTFLRTEMFGAFRHCAIKACSCNVCMILIRFRRLNEQKFQFIHISQIT